jgi:hypothetical protein
MIAIWIILLLFIVALYLVTPVYIVSWLIRQRSQQAESGPGMRCLFLWLASAAFVFAVVHDMRFHGNSSLNNIFLAASLAVLILQPIATFVFLCKKAKGGGLCKKG